MKLYASCTFLSLLMILGAGSQVSAQIVNDDAPPSPSSSAPSSSVSADTDEEPTRLPDVLAWGLTVAESGFKVKAGLGQRSDLVTALEKAVQYLCMSDLQISLTYKKPPADSECQRRLARLIEIDPSNPTGQCATHGIDSTACLTAYSRQETIQNSSYVSGTKNSARELDQVLSNKDIKGRIESIEAEIRKAESQQLRKPSEENRQHVTDLYTRALNISCVNWSIGLKEEAFRPPSVTRRILPTPTPTPQNESLLDRLSGKEKEVPVAFGTITRSRLVDVDCIRLINLALSFDSGMVSAVCARSGAYSPKCITARRKNRGKQKKTSTTSTPRENQRKGGFETF